MFAELDARDGRRHRAELPPDLGRRTRLHVPEVDVAGTAKEEDKEAGVPPILDGRRTRIGQGSEAFEAASGEPEGGEPSDPQELSTCPARSPRFRPFPEDRKHGAAPQRLP